MNDEKKVEILYDHYKDSFQQQIRYIENRNRYFLIPITVISSLLIFIADPTTKTTVAQELIKKYIGENIKFTSFYINSILLFGLLWVVVLYFQSIQTINRHYKYIHYLEDELTKSMEPFSISREGKFFKRDNTWAQKLVTTIYNDLFPSSIIFVILGILFTKNPEQPKIYFSFDLVLSLLIIVFTALHMVRTHKKSIIIATEKKTEQKN